MKGESETKGLLAGTKVEISAEDVASGRLETGPSASSMKWAPGAELEPDGLVQLVRQGIGREIPHSRAEAGPVPDSPGEDVTVFGNMTLPEAAKKACGEPMLVDALSWICVWESERAIRQTFLNCRLEGESIIRTEAGRKGEKGWDTCFRISLEAVMEEWDKRKKGKANG